MARNGTKTGGRDFKPGNPGGPGRPRIPEDQKIAMQKIKGMRSAITLELQEAYFELVHLPPDELTKLANSKDSSPGTSLKLLVARSLVYAMKGKASELQIHKELMCGPEPKQFELSGPGGEPLSPLASYSEEKLLATLSVLDELIREAECKSIPNSQPSSALPAQSSQPESGTA